MIIAWIILVLAVVALALQVLNVPVSQRAINILLLLLAVLVAVGMLWGERLVLS